MLRNLRQLLELRTQRPQTRLHCPNQLTSYERPGGAGPAVAGRPPSEAERWTKTVQHRGSQFGTPGVTAVNLAAQAGWTGSTSASPAGASMALAADDVATLHAAHYADICRAVAWYLGDRAQAEEVVQEAFIKVFRNRDRVRPDDAVGYLRTIALNNAKDRIRQNVRDHDLVSSGNPRVGLASSDVYPVRAYQPVERETDLWHVRQEIARLSPEHRQVIVMHYYWDMPDKEIAQFLGEKESTVRSRLHRARKTLKPNLERGD